MHSRSKFFLFIIPLSVAFLVAPGMSSVASAQGADNEIEEIITTGTRRAERTASDSSVPIDVIGGAEFENQGSPDLDDMLRNTLPSYNVQRHAIDDAATLVRPATMRGLPPDNVLILVNGKRRHRSGVIAEFGGSLAAGSQGADLASIPPMAIKQLEVLRDGAAAQYGSDAIAGVMNFILRDDSDGFAVEARYGEFMEGDGALTQISANAGFPLGDDGFANVTAQWKEQDPTSRSTQRTDATNLIASGNTDVRQPYAQIMGAPEFRDDFNIFLNSGIQLSDSQEVYAFGNYGERETEGGFFFRNPNSRGAVYTNGDIRAVVDTTISPGDTNVVSSCPSLRSPGSGGSGPLDPNEVAQDDLALADLANNPDCWVKNFAVPGGYTPQFGGQLVDMSGVMGIRGEMGNGLLYDFSGGAGRNDVAFFLNNTWNPSNGPGGLNSEGNLKRDFDVGSYIETDVSINADFVLPIAVDAFASDLTFAFGAEWRNEQFETILGETSSWNVGDYSFQSGFVSGVGATNCYGDPNAPGTCDLIRLMDGTPELFDDVTEGAFVDTRISFLPDLSSGSHGFAGFSPIQAGKWDRSNYAVYGELEADITERFTASVAVRFEDFQDFGTTTNGKVSARFALTDAFALRGSYSTGFRAPTPGQANVTKVTTGVVNGELEEQGTIPPTNPVAMILGGEALRPEDAVNFSAGIVWDATDSLSITADFYQIVLEDRITQTGDIPVKGAPVPPEIAGECPGAVDLPSCLQIIGIPGAAALSSVKFFTNDFETTTNGIELVATWGVDWGNAGDGTLTAAWNWTETEVDDAGEEVSRNRVVDLENFNSKNRGIFTYTHFIGGFRLLGRASFYDEWVSADFDADATPVGPSGTGYTLNCGVDLDACYDAEWVFDLEAGYTFNDKYSLIVGASNIGDNNGPLDIDNQSGVGTGNTYDQSTPFGQDGGFYYFRLRADFD